MPTVLNRMSYGRFCARNSLKNDQFWVQNDHNILSIWLKRKLRPWTPHALGLRTLAKLVSVWFRFTKISSTCFASPQFTVEHKNDHNSKTKNRTKKKLINSNTQIRTLWIIWGKHHFWPFLDPKPLKMMSLIHGSFNCDHDSFSYPYAMNILCYICLIQIKYFVCCTFFKKF